MRTARRYRTIEIQVGEQTITAEEPLPDDLRRSTPSTVSGLRTNLAELRFTYG